jgi:hypothetical protein
MADDLRVGRLALVLLLLGLVSCANETVGPGHCEHWGDPFNVPDSVASVDVIFCVR